MYEYVSVLAISYFHMAPYPNMNEYDNGPFVRTNFKYSYHSKHRRESFVCVPDAYTMGNLFFIMHIVTIASRTHLMTTQQ